VSRGEGEKQGRVDEIDVLRGFALFGILVVNARMLAGTYAAEIGGAGASTVDRVADWLVTAVVSTEFYLPFSFLFGYSFVLQARSARRAGAVFEPLHLRRTVMLFALGAAHAVLLFPGDILMTYAVLALVLYGLRGLTAKAALRVAARLVVVLSVLLLAYGLLTLAFAEPAAPARYTPQIADTVAAYRGEVLSVIGAHLHDLRAQIGSDLLFAPDILAAFLAGLAAAKVGLVERRGRDRRWLRRVVVRWLPVGLVGSLITAFCVSGPLDARWFWVGQAVATLTAPALMASYACGVMVLLNSEGRGQAAAGRVVPRALGRNRAAAVLAAAGRMSLTHYLTQSLVLAFVFTGYGFALYGRVGTALVLVGCVLLYTFQLALCTWLMGRVRYGPVELLLRTVTLARRPGRRAATSAASRPAGSGSRPAR